MSEIDYGADSPKQNQEALVLKAIQISSLAEKQIALEKEVSRAEAYLNDKKKELSDIQEKRLPLLMHSAGLKAFPLPDGKIIKVEKSIYGSLAGEKKKNAIQFLIEHGRTALIKGDILLSFNKEEHDKMLALNNELIAKGFTPELDESVNTASFKKLVDEMRSKEGLVIDLQQYGLYEVTRAILKDK